MSFASLNDLAESRNQDIWEVNSVKYANVRFEMRAEVHLRLPHSLDTFLR